MQHPMIHSSNFQEEIENTKGLVLLDFYAVWCGPCKMLAPILDEVAAERPDVKICKSDVDEASDLAAKFGVQSIPTVILFKDGKMVDGFVGYRGMVEILSMLDKHA